MRTTAAGEGLSGDEAELLAELAVRAEAVGVRKLLAVIGDSANAGSIGLHRALGFTDVGVMRSVGWKFGAWRDIVQTARSHGALCPHYLEVRYVDLLRDTDLDVVVSPSGYVILVKVPGRSLYSVAALYADYAITAPGVTVSRTVGVVLVIVVLFWSCSGSDESTSPTSTTTTTEKSVSPTTKVAQVALPTTASSASLNNGLGAARSQTAAAALGGRQGGALLALLLLRGSIPARAVSA